MSVKFSTHPIWTNTEPRTSPVVTATPFLVTQESDGADVTPVTPDLGERKLSDASSLGSAGSLDRHFLRSRSNNSESAAPKSPEPQVTESATLPRQTRRRTFDSVRDVSVPSLRRAPSLTNIPVQHVISPPGTTRNRPLSSAFNLSASVPDISDLDFSDMPSFPALVPLRRMSSTDTLIRRKSSTDTEHSVTVVTETKTVTRSPSLTAGSTSRLRRMSTSNLQSFPLVRPASMFDLSPGTVVRRVTTTQRPTTTVVYDSPGTIIRRVSTEKTTRTPSMTEAPVVVRRVVSRSPSLSSDAPVLVRRVETTERRTSATPSPVVRRRLSSTTTTEKTTTEKTTTRRSSLSPFTGDSPDSFTQLTSRTKFGSSTTPTREIVPRYCDSSKSKTTERKTIYSPVTPTVQISKDFPKEYTHKVKTEIKTPSSPITPVLSDSPNSYIRRESTTTTTTERNTSGSSPTAALKLVTDSPEAYTHKVITEKKTSLPSHTLVKESPSSYIRRESTTTTKTEKKTMGPTPLETVKLATEHPSAYTHQVITETIPTPIIRRESTTTTTEKKTMGPSPLETVKLATDHPDAYTHRVITETMSKPPPLITVTDSPTASYIRRESTTTTERKSSGPSPTVALFTDNSSVPFVRKVITEETFGSSPTPVMKLMTEKPVSYIRKVSTETTTEKKTTSSSTPSASIVRLSETPASSIRRVTTEERTSSPTIVKYLTESPTSYICKVTEKTIEKKTSSPFPVLKTVVPEVRMITERTTTHSVPSYANRQVFTQRVESRPQFGIPAITITKPEAHVGTTPFDMTASVKSPSGLTELCDVVSLDDSHYSIKFVPQEMGVHTVSVKHKDMHIPGSPFEFTVGPIAGGGSHKVHAAGPGLERGEVEVPNEFNIYTREAGAGGLSIAVEGPSKAEIDFQDKKDGSCQVSYKVAEPGEYYVSVKFNDEHIPDSPFRVQITPSIGDARKCSVQSLQDKGLQPNKPAAFVVNFNGAKGRLTARVVSPSGAEEEALVQEIDDGQYAVRFIPRENGVHLVHVLFDNYHIPDSPFKICVGKVDADAGKVTASGEGLSRGKTGEVAKFVVSTVNAGTGSLAVTVEGPSKVKLECVEVDEGYEFSYKPTAPGDYFICIKYAGTNIAGSPFKAKIEGVGQPSSMQEHASVVVETVTKTSTTTRFSGIQRFSSDATKVNATGKGLTKAFRGQTATFQVDASQAGNNIMYIGMMGPKGPCDELVVKHQGNLVYKVDYKVKESGRYMLIVRWGDQDIPGSPFAVEVQ